MSWPSPADPFYLYNTSEANARRTYYSVSGIPDGAVDGTSIYPGSPNGWNAINAASQVAPGVTLDVTGAFDDMILEGELDISIYPAATVAGNHVLHTVLVEDDIYSGGSTHQWVMRDMIPSASGTPVNLVFGEWTDVSLAFSVPDPISPENARLVVFVQNPSTKEVHNAYSVPVLSILVQCDNAQGDLIDLGNINVQDLVLMVSIIMGTAEDQEYCTYKAADVNEDTYTNIQDVILLVEMILGG